MNRTTNPQEAQAPTSAKKTPNPTRENLIEVGLKLMRERGFGATGLQDILRTASTPKGSFYHHFGSKEEFTIAVIERYAKANGEYIGAVLGDHSVPPLARLKRYFEGLVKMAGNSAPLPGCLVGDLSLEVAASSELIQNYLKDSFAGWQAAVASVLKEAIEQGALSKTTDADRLAGFLLNSWEGALLRSQADKDDAPLETFLHYVFEGLLAE